MRRPNIYLFDLISIGKTLHFALFYASRELCYTMVIVAASKKTLFGLEHTTYYLSQFM